MNHDLEQAVKKLAEQCGQDRTRMMDIVRGVQTRFNGVSKEAMKLIAEELGVPAIEVEATVSFYSFLSSKQKGSVVIRVSDCVPCVMAGAEGVMEAFSKELEISAGETTSDGAFTLEYTACVGMCDQGPVALFNEVPVVGIDPAEVPNLIKQVRKNGLTALLDRGPAPNVIKDGPIVLGKRDLGLALTKAISVPPETVIETIKKTNLRGRGGAGFPTGLKLQFARGAEGNEKYVVCNADEGEPGTFKDRIILTERPESLFEGMAIAGYAIGAQQGVIYLRGEYAFLKPGLEAVLDRLRSKGFLGQNIGGKEGFNFDIRIQLGAGAYVCGEESALIESAEGKRGIPRNRPPFPVQVGYLGKPTSVNNVETFATIASIIATDGECMIGVGTQSSAGSKLLSVSGDCKHQGVYEVPWGMTISEFLVLVGGTDAIAVQVGGPSGTLVPKTAFSRKICYGDVATGGSMIVFGPDRDLLEVASRFMAFFVEESCGWCVPCRVGNVLIKERLDLIRAGKGVAEDLCYLEQLCKTVKTMSRCGLGQTSPNPVQITLKDFRHLYEEKLVQPKDGRQPSFDLNSALADAVVVQGRAPVFHD